MVCRFSVQLQLHPSAELFRSQRSELTAQQLSHLKCHKNKCKTAVFGWPIVSKSNKKEKCKWKNQHCFPVSFLVYVFHYEQSGVGLPVFSLAIKNTTAYKHSETLEGGTELMASFSFCFAYELRWCHVLWRYCPAWSTAYRAVCPYCVLQGLGTLPRHTPILSCVWSCAEQRLQESIRSVNVV